MKHILIATAILLASTASVFSGQLFPQQIKAFEQELSKLGEYRYVYRLFFKLYEAALFAPKGAGAEEVLKAETAFQIRFRYLREIDKSIILKSADKMLQKNLSPEEYASIAERVEIINAAYTTVRDGDESSLTYKPSVGTTLIINGKEVVTIEGRDFAQLYFQIWLGEQAISQSLKQNLLGKM